MVIAVELLRDLLLCLVSSLFHLLVNSLPVEGDITSAGISDRDAVHFGHRKRQWASGTVSNQKAES